MKQIALANTYKTATVDDCDFELVSKHSWSIHKRGHVHGWGSGKHLGKRSVWLKMHQLIMGKREGLVIDHKDGNKLNNTRENLRWATKSQNAQNMKAKKVGSSSEYKGVRFAKNSNKWAAQITQNYKTFHLGLFETQEEAAMAYNSAASERFGEFARLNVI